MKLYKYISSVLLIAILATSCKKQLDTNPPFNFDEEDIQNLDDAERVLGGVYAKLRNIDYYGNLNSSSGYSTLPDIISDNFEETVESLQALVLLTYWGAASDETNIENIWKAAYGVIVQANFVINNVDKFSAADPEKANRLKGQALALRAYVHFDVLRYWGENFEEGGTGKGIPYKEDTDKFTLPARLTVGASLTKIWTDLNAAMDLLADVDRPINTASRKSNIDLNAARAIAARIALYQEDFDNAIDYATDVIAAIPLARLADSAAYRNIWTDQSSIELVWTVNFDPGQGAPGSNIFFPGGNRSSFRVDPLLRATYTTSDIRLGTFIQSVVRGGVAREVLYKFRGRTGLNDGNVNWKVLRTSEMYLIRAEAAARRNTGTDAVNALLDLNTLRGSRIRNYVPGTEVGQALINAIALERRKELLGEGHRWFDIKRTDRVIDRNSGDELPANDRFWAWPIPFAELQTNPMPQNDGY